MNAQVRPITQCRLCDSPDLKLQIDFGSVPLGNNLQETPDAALSAERYPLALNRCQSCSHFQLAHAVAPEILYATNYTYLSGIGDSFRRHFAEYASWADDKVELTPGSLIVDVGSNDGTCLKAFQALGHRVCGVDPAQLAAEIANSQGVETLNTFFGADAADAILARHGQADFVTSHNVFAHVDDLAGVFRSVHRVLRDGGHFCFEVGYFREVLRQGCFDTIYHEHLDYHHAAPLVGHLTALGFELLELSVNSVQGGSLRLLLRKGGSGVAPGAVAFLEEERRSPLYDAAFLADWKEKIEAEMGEFRSIVRSYADRGASIVAYGAPTKATLLLAMADVGADEIAFVVEDNPHKAGRFLPSSAIPIRMSDALEDADPDVIVVLAWNFAEDIIRKLTGRFGKPVDLVIPLPDLRTVTL